MNGGWDFLFADNRFQYWAPLAGAIPAAIVSLRNQYVQAWETMLARYDAINNNIQYQQLCLAYPELQTSWYAADSAAPLEPLSGTRKKVMFDIMTSMFERAFPAYRLAPAKIKRSQWPGWKAFIEHFAGRGDYRSWWSENGTDLQDVKSASGKSQYDADFEAFMLATLKVRGKSAH